MFTEEYLRSIDPDCETRGDLLTARDAAVRLGVSQTLVERWARWGYVKPITEQPRLYWEHDLLDCLTSSSRQRVTRDECGRFLARVALV